MHALSLTHDTISTRNTSNTNDFSIFLKIAVSVFFQYSIGEKTYKYWFAGFHRSEGFNVMLVFLATSCDAAVPDCELLAYRGCTLINRHDHVLRTFETRHVHVRLRVVRRIDSGVTGPDVFRKPAHDITFFPEGSARIDEIAARRLQVPVHVLLSHEERVHDIDPAGAVGVGSRSIKAGRIQADKLLRDEKHIHDVD
jgi:hypothetical protein